MICIKNLYQLSFTLTAAFFLSFPISTSAAIKEKVDSLYNIGWEYLDRDDGSVIYTYNLQNKLAIQANYELGQVNANYLIGLYYSRRLFFDKAALHFYKALDIAEGKNSIRIP